MMRTPSLYPRQTGYVLSTEYLLFATILVIGLLVGWVTLRDSFNAELMDTSNAIESSITYYYFNDPDRGTGPGFTEDTLEFVLPSDDESTSFLIGGDPPVITPSTGTSASGTITTGLQGSEAGGFGATPSATGSVEPPAGSESGDPAAGTSATGTVEPEPGSETGGG